VEELYNIKKTAKYRFIEPEFYIYKNFDEVEQRFKKPQLSMHLIFVEVQIFTHG
jgi:hypothetical protein